MAPTNSKTPTGQTKVRVRHCCSISNLVKLTASLNEPVRALLARTPFHFLLHLPSTEVNAALLHSLIDGWDFDQNAFPFGPTLIPFTTIDVAYILGLRALGTHIPLDHDYGMSRVHTLLESFFPGTTVTAHLLYELVGKVESPEDGCRVYLAYAFCTYLFSLTNKGVHGHFFSLLDDLEGLHEFAWGRAVYDFLLAGIKQAHSALKHKKCVNEIHIKGCGPLLQIWALEHTLVVDQTVHMWPRIRKWTSKTLSNSTAMPIVEVSAANQVVLGLKPTSKEKNKKVIKEILGLNNPSAIPSNSPPLVAASYQHAVHHAVASTSAASISPLPDVPQSAGAESPHICEFKSTSDQLLADNKALGDTFSEKCFQYDELFRQHTALQLEHDKTRAAYDELQIKYSVLGQELSAIKNQAPPSDSSSMLPIHVTQQHHSDEFLQPSSPHIQPTFQEVPHDATCSIPSSSVCPIQPDGGQPLAVDVDVPTPPTISSQPMSIDPAPIIESDDDVVFLEESTMPPPSSTTAMHSTIAARLRKNPRLRYRGRHIRSPWTAPSQPARKSSVVPPPAALQVHPLMVKWLPSHLFYHVDTEEDELISDFIYFDFNSIEYNKDFVCSGNGLVDLKHLEPLVIKGKSKQIRRWLSTEIVDAYIDLLRWSFPLHDTLAINTFFVYSYASILLVQGGCSVEVDLHRYLQGVESYDQVILPVIDNGHWMVAVVNRITHSIIWLDSFPSAVHHALGVKIVAWILHSICNEIWNLPNVADWHVDFPHGIPVQEDNMDDCGVYALAFIVCFATNGKLLEFKPEHVGPMRHRILLELVGGSLLPPIPQPSS